MSAIAKIKILFLLLIFLLSSFSMTYGFTATEDYWELSGGSLKSFWDPSTGRLIELIYTGSTDGKNEKYAFVNHFIGPAGLEVFDELERVHYTDRRSICRVTNVLITSIGAFRKIEFEKHFQEAPFVVRMTLSADVQGIYMEAEVILQKKENGRWPNQRNVRISFVIPAGDSLTGWAPSYPDPYPLKEQPVRYCYGSQEPETPRVGIPLYTIYRRARAGLSIVMPLDLPKVQLNMGPEPEEPQSLYLDFKDIDWAKGNYAGSKLKYLKEPAKIKSGKVSVVRVTEYFVGLIADRPLHFGVWLFGHEPHWRPALGKLVQAYPEYFRMDPRARSIYGSRLGTTLRDITHENLSIYRRFGATTTWFHTHFYRHGEFIPPEAVIDPDFEFFCEPYSDQYPNNSVRKNREAINKLTENGQGVFLYGFNMHCDTITVAQLGFFADVARKRDGTITKAYHDQPVMFFKPTSPYGRHLLRQMDLMKQLYPRIMGIGLDNWAYGGIDFGHDDGITMFGHRPAANINFSQQSMIETISRKWHSNGKLVMVNKARTVESMKGADFLLSEANDMNEFIMYAFMCLDRHLHPNVSRVRNNPDFSEQVIRITLLWGGQFGKYMYQADPEMAMAYFHLIQYLRNRTWVFEPDPLTLPPGLQGNIFRIHTDSPWNPGDIIVPIVRKGVKFADREFKDSLQVMIRLPEVNTIVSACWLGVEGSDKAPQNCLLFLNDNELKILLPPVGAAGLLRLKGKK